MPDYDYCAHCAHSKIATCTRKGDTGTVSLCEDHASTYDAVHDRIEHSPGAVERESIKALREAIKLQETKGSDYNGTNIVHQAEYYPRGIISIHEMMNAKMLRLKSVMGQAYQHNKEPKHESLRDSALDLINYTSFFIEYLARSMEGQNPDKNAFNEDSPNEN